MHKIDGDEAQVLTDSSGLRRRDAEMLSEFPGKKLVGVLLLLWVCAASKTLTAKQTGSLFLLSPFFGKSENPPRISSG